MEGDMAQYRTIEVDFDVHKVIESERRSFDDPPNAALRRLLKIDDPHEPPSPPKDLVPPAGRPWSDSGVVLPHGTLVRMRYGRDQLFQGEIADRQWVVDGRSFDSPSGAASELAVTKRGVKTKLNGWNYWEVKRSGDAQWVRLDTLRKSTMLEDLGMA
jgi:hypothetical protein